jgi:hypothetical protein
VLSASTQASRAWARARVESEVEEGAEGAAGTRRQRPHVRLVREIAALALPRPRTVGKTRQLALPPHHRTALFAARRGADPRPRAGRCGISRARARVKGRREGTKGRQIVRGCELWVPRRRVLCSATSLSVDTRGRTAFWSPEASQLRAPELFAAMNLWGVGMRSTWRVAECAICSKSDLRTPQAMPSGMRSGCGSCSARRTDRCRELAGRRRGLLLSRRPLRTARRDGGCSTPP